MSDKTWTQDEVDKKVRDTADASFKAGQEKATKSKEAEAQNRKFEAQQKELELYKQKEQQNIKEAKINNLISSVKKMEDIGLARGQKRFIADHFDELKEVESDKLPETIKKLRDKLPKEDKDYFFNSGDVDATKGMRLKGEKEADDDDNYIPGTSIRRPTARFKK